MDVDPSVATTMMNSGGTTTSSSGASSIDHSAQGPYRHVGAAHRMKLLPVDFVPSDDDVICGRGKKCYSHVGNDRFRERVKGFLEMYREARTKLDKSKVLNLVVEEVRQNSPAGGFVKQDESGRWHEVGDFLAREKTSQAFRDCLHENYKSSSVAKKKRRQDEMGKVTERIKMPRSTVDIAQKIQNMSMQMKKAAKGASQTARRGDPNADILAGIEFANRVMRQDAVAASMGQEFPNLGVRNEGSGVAGGGGGGGFELEFEPDDYVVRSASAGPGVYESRSASSLNFNLPTRSRSMVEQHSDNTLAMSASAPNLGVTRRFSEGMFQPVRSMAPMFGGYESNSSGNNYSSSQQTDSMVEEFHHSLPNEFEFDPSQLMNHTTERLHHSAPTLCHYSPAELLQPDTEPTNATIPSNIEFPGAGLGGGSGGVPPGLLAQQQQQQQIRHQQLIQQQQQLIEQRRQQIAQQQAFLLRQQQQVQAGLMSSLENFAGMELDDNDDNPFEPIPIDEQIYATPENPGSNEYF